MDACDKLKCYNIILSSYTASNIVYLTTLLTLKYLHLVLSPKTSIFFPFKNTHSCVFRNITEFAYYVCRYAVNISLLRSFRLCNTEGERLFSLKVT
jgi:hypothetical protein